jgi:hypothetical protein
MTLAKKGARILILQIIKTKRREVAMSQLRRMCNTFVVTGLLILSSSTVNYSQDQEKKKQLPQGTPILWRVPVNLDARDLCSGQVVKG